MTTPNKPNANAINNNNNDNDMNNTIDNDGIKLELDYRAPSQLITQTATQTAVQQADSLASQHAQAHTQHVALFTQLNRDDVQFHATIKAPIVFRDSLMALFDVVSSDYRYIPKDRSAYTVFMQMRRSNANKNLFNAQRDYFNWLFNNDPLAFCILDPIIQVHEDGVSFEVFSRDEGCYAQLTLTHEVFESRDKAVLGTTSIDYSSALYNGISSIRSYEKTVLDIGQEAVSLARKPAPADDVTDTEAGDTKAGDTEAKNQDQDNIDTAQNSEAVIEKRINVPKSWIRSLLQVQSATQLSTDTIHLDPMALYNVLFELRMHADIKGKRRGLLIELQPNQAPVILLEPFNIAVTNQVSSTPYVYHGKQAKIIRLWGRRRLSLLKRLLPHTDSVTVSLLGQGMPSYWVLSGTGFRFTFAMTGFSQANWSQSLNFDLLLPKRPEHTQNDDLKPLLHQLQQAPRKRKDLYASGTDNPNKKTANKTAISAQLLSATQQGLVRYDIATDTYYYRPLTQTPLDMAQFTYHNEAEKQAYALIARKNAVQKFNVDNIPTKGMVISGDIEVIEDRRTYHSQLQLNDEGMVARAECSCPQYLQHRLTQGVCAHLITLRLAYNNYDNSAPRNGSWQQTCVLSKRLSTSQRGGDDNSTSTSNKNANASASASINSESDNNSHVLNLATLAKRSANTADKHNKNKQNINKASAKIATIYITVTHKKVLIEQRVDEHSTRQQFIYNQPKHAFDAFLQHIKRFEAKGFIENKGI